MVKYKKIVFFILSLWAGYGSAQYRAANWVINKYYLTILPGGIELDSFPPGGGYLGFLAKASIGDEQGNLLLFSNAIDVRNRNGIVIENGSNLCESIDWPEACIPGVNGSPHIQGALIIPNPGKPNQYYLFIKDMATDIPWEQPMRVTASLIDMSYNTGLGKVLQRAVPILNDTLSDSRMTACKHANGRDWWLINHEYNTNRIYTHLITPDTILGPYSQYTGGGGQKLIMVDGLYSLLMELALQL
ncbi:MAG: hypothetical protein KIS94_05140 [Chitinophagales bacterium]|nr:hypothetical protein [Chitinophagales bacterium]